MASDPIVDMILRNNNALQAAAAPIKARMGIAPQPTMTRAPFDAPIGQAIALAIGKKQNPGYYKKTTTAIPKQTDPLQALKDQMNVQKQKIAAAGTAKPGKSIWSHLGDVGMDVAHAGGSGLQGALGVAGALGRGVEAYGSTTLLGTHGGSRDALNPFKQTIGAILNKKQNVVTGKDIVDTLGAKGMSGGWQKSALENLGGFGIDTLTDPLTYVTPGISSLGDSAVGRAVTKAINNPIVQNLAEKKTIDLAGKAAKEGLSHAQGVRVAGAAKALSADEIKAEAARQTVKRAEEVQNKLDWYTSKAANSVKVKPDDISKQILDAAAPRLQAAKDELSTHGLALSTDARQKIINEEVTKSLEPFKQHVTDFMTEGAKRRAQIKIAGHDILGHGAIGSGIGRALYKPGELALAGANKLPGFKTLDAAFGKAFKMGDHFPGLTERMRRVAESRGVVDNEAMQKTIDGFTKNLTDKEQELVLKSLEDGTSLKGVIAKDGKTDLGHVQTFFDGLRDHMFDTHVEGGTYQDAQRAPGWVPHFYRSGDKEKILDFKAGRKAALRSQGSIPTAPFSIEAAKEAGLKPFTRVGDAFKSGYADMTRKAIGNNFASDFMNTYGMRTANGELAAKLGLKDVTQHAAPAIQQEMARTSERMYAHPELARAFESMMKMNKMGDDVELHQFMRKVAKTTNVWKRSATVYNPGNWLNNSVGDMYMNMLDGVVDPRRYAQAIKLLKDAPTGTMHLGGYDIPASEVKRLYERWASGAGQMRADIEHSYLGSKLSAAPKLVNKGYQGREDIGRLAHFVDSLHNELKHMPKEAASKLGPSHIPQLEQAAEAAGQRVSKWNLDYSAFTPFEKSLKRNVVPFYSWVRKAMPLMAEGVATKPGRVLAVSRLQNAIGQMTGGDAPGGTVYPLWLRDLGFTRITQGNNPWALPNQLPSNIFGKQFGGSSFKDLMAKQASMLHPALRIPIEIGAGTQFFNGQKMPTDPKSIAENEFPPGSTIGAILGRDFRTGKTEDWRQRIGSLVGDKPFQITDQTQKSELRRQQDALDFTLKQLQAKAGDWSVRKTKSGYQVYNKTTKEKRGTYVDPGDAEAASLHAAGVKTT